MKRCSVGRLQQSKVHLSLETVKQHLMIPQKLSEDHWLRNAMMIIAILTLETQPRTGSLLFNEPEWKSVQKKIEPAQPRDDCYEVCCWLQNLENGSL